MELDVQKSPLNLITHSPGNPLEYLSSMLFEGSMKFL